MPFSEIDRDSVVVAFRWANTEAGAGFPAFQFGDRGEREIDFVTYRKRLAEVARFDAALVKEILPPSARKKLES